jgi:hypothetical protein
MYIPDQREHIRNISIYSQPQDIQGLFKKYWTLIFPAQTNQAREVSIIVDVEGTFMRMREFFPVYRKCQSPAVGRWLCKCCERSSDCQLLVLQNDGKTWAVVLHRILPKPGDTQVETIRKIQQAFGDDAMSITRIKDGSTNLAAPSRQCTRPFFASDSKLFG